MSVCSVKKNLAEKWKLNVLTDLLTSFKICSRFYFANSLLVELKASNIIKSLVISSTRNKTGLNLGWVFAGFFRWVYPKKPGGFFGVSTRVSEPCYKRSFMTLFCCIVFCFKSSYCSHYIKYCAQSDSPFHSTALSAT